MSETNRLFSKSSIFWGIMSCNLLQTILSFGGTRSLHLQDRISQAIRVTCFMMVSCLTYSSILKTKAICSSEMSVCFQLTTLCHLPNDKTLHNHRCENFSTNPLFLNQKIRHRHNKRPPPELIQRWLNSLHIQKF
jgi:hypothetical protein